MATLTVEISDELKAQLDDEFASGRFTDSNAMVQSMLEQAIQRSRRESINRKLAVALEEVERGEVAPWQKGDAVKLGSKYLQDRRVNS